MPCSIAIRIEADTKEKIEKLRECQKETMDSVIRRLIQNYELIMWEEEEKNARLYRQH